MIHFTEKPIATCTTAACLTACESLQTHIASRQEKRVIDIIMCTALLLPVPILLVFVIDLQRPFSIWHIRISGNAGL
jgi:hypothetical protein